MEYTCVRKCYFMDRLIKEDQVIEVDSPSDNDKLMLDRCFECDEPAPEPKKKRTRKAAPKKTEEEKVEDKLPDSPAPGFLE
jgi:uncharacterized protein with PIN domain